MQLKCLLPLTFVLAAGVSAADKPNILFIAIDDLKPMVAAYGENIPTPAFDRIAAQGTTFLNAHCQQAVCGPSRASLMTGKRPDYTRVWDLQTEIRSIHPDILTLPQYMKSHGYFSAGVGKIYDPRSVDKGADTASWSQPYRQTWHLKYDATTGKPSAHYQDPRIKELATEAEAMGEKGWGPINRYLLKKDAWPAVEAVDVPDDAYDDGAIAAYAVSELAKLATRDEPFFFAVGFKKPHLPFVAPKKYWDLFDRESLELALFQRQAVNSPDLAYHNWPELRSYSGIPAEGELDEATQRELIHGYYACVAYIDAQIGKIIDQLDTLDLADDTIIVLWGDHGFHLGDHGLWCKHSNLEHATRVPLIIAAPQGKAGQLSTMPVELIDIFPTLCDLTDLELPTHLDGVSLAPVLTEGAGNIREFAVSQYPRSGHMGYALRTERFRYVAWYENLGKDDEAADGSGTPVATELYDYKHDPRETRNLANEIVYAEISAELGTKLTQFLQDYSKK
jgi:iduronate 2-sulfatase